MATPFIAKFADKCHGCKKTIKPGQKAVWSRIDGWNYHEDCSPEKKLTPGLTICDPGNAEGAGNPFPQSLTSYHMRNHQVVDTYIESRSKGEV